MMMLRKMRKVILQMKKNNQKFIYKQNRIINCHSGKCLSLLLNNPYLKNSVKCGIKLNNNNKIIYFTTIP